MSKITKADMLVLKRMLRELKDNEQRLKKEYGENIQKGSLRAFRIKQIAVLEKVVALITMM